uniref:Maestro heat like repeat family member 1 n=1 Tax=Ornithorhynchus anatinus TaxID=9258 RepID=A0A6I8P743_ORNAN
MGQRQGLHPSMFHRDVPRSTWAPRSPRKGVGMGELGTEYRDPTGVTPIPGPGSYISPVFLQPAPNPSQLFIHASSSLHVSISFQPKSPRIESRPLQTVPILFAPASPDPERFPSSLGFSLSPPTPRALLLSHPEPVPCQLRFLNPPRLLAQLSTDNLFHILKTLEQKIINSKNMNTTQGQKVTDSMIRILVNMKPQGELEELASYVIVAVGLQCPGTIIMKLWDKVQLQSLPPRGLLLAMAKLSCKIVMVPYIGAAWDCILPILRKAQAEEDMLALCSLLHGLAASAHQHLEMGSEDEFLLDITRESVAIKATLTLRVLFNRWPLKHKNKVTEATLDMLGNLFFLMRPEKLKCQLSWLIRRLLDLSKLGLEPLYITKCLCSLLEAVVASGSGSVNLTSHLSSLLTLLSGQVAAKVVSSAPLAEKNHIMALKAFRILTQLYNERMIKFLRRNLENKDVTRINKALQIFRYVVLEVPQTEKLMVQVMPSVIHLIQDNKEPVRSNLLQLIEALGQGRYFEWPEGEVILDYILQLSVPKPSESQRELEIRLTSINILHLVPLPRLVTLLCQPQHAAAFVPLCKTATNIALRARASGAPPYLSYFHCQPTKLPSPQMLLTHLLLHALEPFKGGDYGSVTLWLLHSLHPLNSAHPVLHYTLGQLWIQEIPQLLQFLEGHNDGSLKKQEWEKKLLQFAGRSVEGIADDSWLKDLCSVILERIQCQQEPAQRKAFLYKLYGSTLRVARDPEVVKTLLAVMLSTSHTKEIEKQGIAATVSLVSTLHLSVVLEVLQDFSSTLVNGNQSNICNLSIDQQQPEWRSLFHTIYLCYSQMAVETQTAILPHADFILTHMLEHFHSCIVVKDRNLKLSYLSGLAMFTDVVGSLDHCENFDFPHKTSVVASMVDLIREEPLTKLVSPVRQQAMTVIYIFRKLKPPLVIEQRVEVLKTCFSSVLSLPPVDVMAKEASGSPSSPDTMVLYSDTLQALRKMLEGLVMELPSRIQNCLENLDPWLNSQKDHERERAMWCSVRILSFAAKPANFNEVMEFSRLGRLVRLLAMRCQDPVDNISYLASQAVYYLHCILLHKKRLERQQKGERAEGSKEEGIYSPSVFFNNTPEIAKVSGEVGFCEPQIRLSVCHFLSPGHRVMFTWEIKSLSTGVPLSTLSVLGNFSFHPTDTRSTLSLPVLALSNPLPTPLGP